MTELFLGIDGGQSSTTALIGDSQGRVIGYGRGGPCNHVQASEGRAKFINAIQGCVAAACLQAALDPAAVRFSALCAGFSGGPADKESLLREILDARQIAVTHDGLIALAGATAGAPGIITIAGTGSFCFGRNAAGGTARAGGWGYVFGDEGGGFDLTRQALRAALRMEEGWGPSTALRARLLDASAASDINDLLHQFYTASWPRPKIAALSALVDETALHGDPVARQILEQSAQHLAAFTAAVRHQLFKEGEPARVAHIGGVYRSRFLLERFRLLVELEDGNTCGPPIFSPAAGALLEAYRLASLSVSLQDVPNFDK